MDKNKDVISWEPVTTIHRLFEEQAARTPERTALVASFESGSKASTYGALNRKANQLAHRLIEYGVQPDDIVGLTAERSIEMIIGMLAILKAGACYLPIDAQYPGARREYMIKNSGARLLLTYIPADRLRENPLPELPDVRILDLQDKGAYARNTANPNVRAHDHNLLYAIYTSGSTGTPKGVLLEHRNLINLILFQYRHTAIDFSSVLQFTTISFDVSFQEIFSTLLCGGTLYLISRDTMQNIPELARVIRENGIRTLFLPASFLKFILSQEDYLELFPATIRHIVTAGEQLVVTARFREFIRKNRITLHNHYGPSEAHVVTTLTLPPDSDIPDLPSVGKPLDNTWIHLLDEHFSPVPDGETGELYIGGVQVGRGYLNRPELTAEKFIRLPNVTGDSPWPMLYRTGDLARRLPDGAIDFLGRIDFQVKIRGFRVEPGEVEILILGHEMIKEAAVIAREAENGEKFLCAYIVPHALPDTAKTEKNAENTVPMLPGAETLAASVREHLAARVPDYMVPTWIIPIAEIPLTPNRKVNAQLLPMPDVTADASKKTAPRNVGEEKLAAIWAKALGLAPGAIGIDDNFLALGGHSLKAAIVISEVIREFAAPITLREIFQCPTIRELAPTLSAAATHKLPPISGAADRRRAPLSSAQKRLFILHRLNPSDVSYNIPLYYTIAGTFRRSRLESAFQKLMDRHESLRTSFHQEQDEPWQTIHDSAAFRLETSEPLTGAGELAERLDYFIRPFDLAIPPLIRATVLTGDAINPMLLVDMHHIISDGVSVEILERELCRLYDDESLPIPAIQYRHFAAWEARERTGQRFLRQEAHWLSLMKDFPPMLQLPQDFPRPIPRNTEGKLHPFAFPPALSEAVRKLATETGATPFMILSAFTAILLMKLSGQEDLLFGVPASGRIHPDLEPLIGMFVNTLPLRSAPAGEKPFLLFLMEIRQAVIAVFENQEYPFEELLQRLGVSGDADHNPLFDMVFALDNIKAPLMTRNGLHLHPYRHHNHSSKFDLTLIAQETETGFEFEIEYGSAMFKPSTIARFARYYEQIAALAVQQPRILIMDMELISPAERKQLVETFNDNGREWSVGDTLIDFFSRSVQRCGDLPAVVNRELQWFTYQEVDDLSNRISRQLIAAGVQPGDLVGVLTPRSREMIVGILGIIKTGAAYIPMNPKAPAGRTRYMLEDCNARILLADVASAPSCEAVENWPGLILHLHTLTDPSAPEPPASCSLLNPSPADPAYVLYTSGTTGKPKGVLISHRNLSPLIHWELATVDPQPQERFIQNLAFHFDWSVLEIFFALSAAGVLYMLPDDILLNPGVAIDFITEHHITALHATPTQFTWYLRTGRSIPHLKFLFFGGEKVTFDLVRRSYEVLDSGCRIFNHYGPTETTIVSANLEVPPKGQWEKKYGMLASIPVGFSTGNTAHFILDKYLKICPMGVIGELYIAGDGVSAGYINRPELTAERFITINDLRLYKTGDLARWAWDGTIEYLGRIDHQVKIRGFRIELGEVENVIHKHPAVKDAVVIPIDHPGGEKFLCAYIVLKPEIFAEQSEAEALQKIRRHAAGFLPDYMIPTYFKTISEMPFTANGKLDRKALPMPDLEGAAPETAAAVPRDQVEQTIAEIWAAILQIEPHRIGLDQDFFQLGGHSLKATIAAARIEEKFQTGLTLADVFIHRTIGELASCVRDHAAPILPPLAPAPEKPFYSLTSAQKRLFVLQQMEENTIAYNIPALFETERPDLPRLEQAFNALIQRHDILRASFAIVDGSPVQYIHPVISIKISEYPPEPISTFIKPFDLAVPPLLRVGLFPEANGKRVLFVDIHHIVSDGVSMNIFRRELAALYDEKSLPPLKTRYIDFAEWRASVARHPIFASRLDYWLSQFQGELPRLDLPIDFKRPLVQDFRGKTLQSGISSRQSLALRHLALKHGATPFMLFAAAFYILLSRLSGLEDIIIGVPGSGRTHGDIQDIMGMFVNTLALRAQPAGDKTFAAFLGDLRQQSLEAFNNQDYPFEDIVERLPLRRDAARNPLFDVMFVFDDFQAPSRQDGDLGLDFLRFENTVSKFDLTLYAEEDDHNFFFIFEYPVSLFKDASIRRFSRYYAAILSTVAENPGLLLQDIDIFDVPEKQQILMEFNDTGTVYLREMTLQRLFALQAAHTPDAYAVVDLTPGALTRTGYERWTYRELDRLSGAVAKLISEKTGGPGPGCLAAILADRSLELIAGILGILKSGVGYAPLNPKSPAARNRFMLDDCNPAVLVTTRALGENGERFDHWNGEIIFIDDLLPFSSPSGPGSSQTDPEAETQEYFSSAHIAYVIYTSGTTGNPKGVPISHANFSPLLHWGFKNLGIVPEDRFLQNLSHYFDWSVWEIFIALTRGASLHMAGEEILLNPDLAIDCMYENGITVLHITPTQFTWLLKTGRPLHTLRRLFLGAEKFTHDILERAIRTVPPHCRIYNMYGPTEAAIVSATLEADPKDWEERYRHSASISVGRPSGNSAHFILDRHFKPCPVNVAGELYIAGDGLSSGYLNRPELTHERFIVIPNPCRAIDPSAPPSIRLYRTGDLSRWMENGEIEYLGRIDHQVKIRGFRIELGEIENSLLKSPLVRDAVVLAVEPPNEEPFLSAYLIAAPEAAADPAAIIPPLKDHLAAFLPPYMIPTRFMFIQEMPLNPNGKVDRKALLALEPIPTLSGFNPPADELEKKLAIIWAQVLEKDPQHIDANINFFEYGGHSLKATILASRINKEFQARFTLVDIFTRPTLRDMAEFLRRAPAPEHEKNVTAADLSSYHPLSSAQKRLFILQQMEETAIAYNIPLVFETSTPDPLRLEAAFIALIQRHDTLRASFGILDGAPVQRILPQTPFKLAEYPASPLSNLIRPFDLSAPPLLRAGLLPEENGKRILFADVHHIIFDGASLDIFRRELAALYDGAALPPLETGYIVFFRRNLEERSGQAYNAQKDYWLGQFRDEAPRLDLPLDFKRPVIQDFNGNIIKTVIPDSLAPTLRALAQQHDATPFMLFAAAYYLLLSRLSGLEDIIFGIPSSGRSHADIQDIIGMFVNTLAVRAKPQGHKTFAAFLAEARFQFLSAFQNQDFPFEEIADILPLRRDSGRNPLFDVMFSFEHFQEPAAEAGELQLRFLRYENLVSKFDLTLHVEESGPGFFFNIEYPVSLFREETVRRFARYYLALLSAIAAAPHAKLHELEMLDPDEKRRLLLEFNQTGVSFARDITLQQMFATQAARTPEAIAVVDLSPGAIARTGAERWTYRELDRLSDHLAALIRQLAPLCAPDRIAAIMAVRSVEMIAAILAVLKSGAGYLPLNPSAPGARNRFMLEDSGAFMLIASRNLAAAGQRAGDWSGPTLFIDDAFPLPPLTPAEDRFEKTDPEYGPLGFYSPANIAYVIYTSGTTGKPKGVPISHANLCPLLQWGFRHFAIESGDRFLQNLSYYFDWSVWEIFLALTQGASLYMAGEDVLLDPAAGAAAICDHHITVLHITPSQFTWLLKTLRPFPSLRRLFLGAEKLTHDILRRSFLAVEPHCRIFNMYGPTEATIISAAFEARPGEWEETYRHGASIPIGFASGNNTHFILDSHLEPCPVNVPGELYIAGDGLARGYLNRPELTEERFLVIDNPCLAVSLAAPEFIRVYRTGDLARWLPDGAIEFMGRADHQVKIRGFRIELGEIESHLLEHASVREAVVLAAASEEQEPFLAAFIVPAEYQPSPEANAGAASLLKEHLAQSLPAYMIPVLFRFLERLPLNANGKTDRAILLEMCVAPERGEFQAPVGPAEQKLARIWADVLEKDVSAISAGDNFFESGGQSLRAAILASRVLKEFRTHINLVEIFTRPVLREMAELLARQSGSAGAPQQPIAPAEQRPFYPLSAAQKRIYVMQSMEPTNTVYNMATVLHLRGAVSVDRVEDIFRKIICRHESFRTSFHIVADEPVQQVHDHADFAVTYFVLPGDTAQIREKVSREFVRPFDLSVAPLLRVGFVRLAEDHGLLLTDMHHIISDGQSFEILKDEFIALYSGQTLEPVGLQYKDFAVWQTGSDYQDLLARQEAFWLRQFEEEAPVMSLPCDNPRSGALHPPQGSLTVGVEPPVADALRQLTRGEAASMFTLFIALINVFLARISGAEDIIVGTITDGRNREELGRIIGMFVNTLVLRNRPVAGLSFLEFFRKVREDVLEVYRNQDYPFDLLVRQLPVSREVGRNPLFDVIVSFSTASYREDTHREIPGLVIESFSEAEREAKFDLMISGRDQGDGEALYFYFFYNALLFKPVTVEAFGQYLKDIAAHAASDPRTLIRDMSVSLSIQTSDAVLAGADDDFDF